VAGGVAAGPVPHCTVCAGVERGAKGTVVCSRFAHVVLYTGELPAVVQPVSLRTAPEAGYTVEGVCYGVISHDPDVALSLARLLKVVTVKQHGGSPRCVVQYACCRSRRMSSVTP
jgi:hypothetical protein